MNAPTPGWNPDPTGRHEYRYWDGSSWTDDVSDNGVTSVDPVSPAGGPGADLTVPVDQTRQVDPTQQYAPQPGQPRQPPPGGFGAPPPGYDPAYSSGQLPPAQPVRSGPSTGLIVGLAAVAAALIAGLVFFLSRDDETADPDTDPISDEAVTDDSATDDSATDDALDDDLDDLDSSDIGSGDGIVELIAAGMEMEADGAITHDQAICAAQAMVDHFGLEDLMDMSTSGSDPFADATVEEQTAIVDLMTECIPIEVLIDLGMSAEGG